MSFPAQLHDEASSAELLWCRATAQRVHRLPFHGKSCLGGTQVHCQLRGCQDLLIERDSGRADISALAFLECNLQLVLQTFYPHLLQKPRAHVILCLCAPPGPIFRCCCRCGNLCVTAATLLRKLSRSCSATANLRKSCASCGLGGVAATRCFVWCRVALLQSFAYWVPGRQRF